MMMTIVEKIFGTRLSALLVKEFREILRNKYLLFLMIMPPVIQLLILGGSLDPQVRNLSLGTVDRSNSVASRELVDSLLSGKVFKKSQPFADEQKLSQALEGGKLAVGLVIPQRFVSDLNNGTPAQVQVLVDGADAYSAGVASSFVQQTMSRFDPKVNRKDSKVILGNVDSVIEAKMNILYNPDQLSSWYFVPGILGAALTLTATLVASATILKERENGTMEQLLMTPAEPWEILLAKIIPLVVFLLGDVCLAIGAAHLIFALPVRGSFLLLMLASALYAFVGIGFGMLLGSVCNSQRQAQLTSFFINIPLILLSGTVVPFDTMPAAMQFVAIFDPLRYYTLVARGVILKGATLEMLIGDIALLFVFASLLLWVSANRFRRQMT
ncbi:MAG: ABC transporter permease [Candidatus Obscuribacterales bacterium]|jgi:ABC-2 type transport system permease protein